MKNRILIEEYENLVKWTQWKRKWKEVLRRAEKENLKSIQKEEWF